MFLPFSLALALAFCHALPDKHINLKSSEADKASATEKTGNAREIVLASIKAMGGEGRLRALKSLKIEGVGFRHWLEQSERPEGPWITGYEQITEIRDLSGPRVRRTSEARHVQSPRWAGSTMIVYDGVAAFERGERKFPGRAQQVKDAEEQYALAPERVLITALEAKDLKREPDAVLQGISHHVVSFGWGGGTVRVYINPYHFLPMAVETVRAYPDDFFFSVWGDVTMRTTYADWSLAKGGIRYPRQWAVEWNGFPYKEFAVTDFELNVPVPAESFAIPPEIRAAFEKSAQTPQFSSRTVALGQMFNMKQSTVHEPAPGLVIIPGVYTVTLVKQSDGIVIIEAPLSVEYSAKVITEAERRFPGVPIKAVVTTGDAWTYIGGVREYVARGIPVYALDLNKPILERLIKAPRRFVPDTLARNPRAPKITFVGGKTVLGAGPNRIELYPVRGAGGERMMLAFFPEHRILYGSDLVQPGSKAGSFFSPQYLSEVAEAVQREKLMVTSVYAMHLEPTAWKDVEAAIAKAMSAASN